MISPTFDTGRNVPESAATLLAQQVQLLGGRRDVQMFPIGTSELPLPTGFERYDNARGVFHFAPAKISRESIEAVSGRGRENEILNLGPYSKADIANRVLTGELPLTVTEYTPDGVEVRSAAGTDKTLSEQLHYFEQTADPGNRTAVVDLGSVLLDRLGAN